MSKRDFRGLSREELEARLDVLMAYTELAARRQDEEMALALKDPARFIACALRDRRDLNATMMRHLFVFYRRVTNGWTTETIVRELTTMCGSPLPLLQAIRIDWAHDFAAAASVARNYEARITAIRMGAR